MQRLRVRYAKRGRLRFSSHRDFQRALERALRRGRVPVAYSGGFTAHPRVSYAGSAPTGASSEAEFFEIAVTERQEPEALRDVLDRCLPPGLDVLAAVEADGRTSLADRLAASVWRIALPQVSGEDAASAARALLDREQVEVERRTKKGMRRFDVRAAIVTCTVREAPARSAAEDDRPCAILHLVVRHGDVAVRPDDILAGLRVVAGLQPASPAEATRLAQGPLDAETGEVFDPFAPVTGAHSGAWSRVGGEPASASSWARAHDENNTTAPNRRG